MMKNRKIRGITMMMKLYAAADEIIGQQKIFTEL